MSNKIFTVMVTNGSYWYTRLEDMAFDVVPQTLYSGRHVYRVIEGRSTMHSMEIAGLENPHFAERMLDAIINFTDIHSAPWIDPNHCLNIEHVQNQRLSFLLDEPWDAHLK